MAFRLIPKEEKFYADFIAMAGLLHDGGTLLEEMLASEPPLHERAAQIRDLEDKCDFCTHEILDRLNRTFVTPIDREDIHALAGALDDVMDAIDEVATLFPLYRIAEIRPGAREIVVILTAQTAQIRYALQMLEKKNGVLDHAIEINRLEHEADLVHQRSVGQLFDEEKDPVMIMKWQEIFTCLEAATDCCEDVANLIETIVVKHG